jgi:cytochrome P450
MTASNPAETGPVSRASVAQCPFHPAQTLPSDGTPLSPSPTLTAWRDEAPATSLRFADGHEGLVVTQYDLARAVLEDPRFSQQPMRFPLGPADRPPDELDEAAHDAIAAANLLGLDGEQHAKMRRSIIGRFSFRSVRGEHETVRGIVSRQLANLLEQGSPVDLTVHYAQPISALTHCHVLGVPDALIPEFIARFVSESSTQEKFDYIREVLERKTGELGEDVLSDLLRSELSRAEIEGIVLVLMTSGRDSVAYMIATSTVALLTNPDQLAALRADPELIAAAIEEFMRFGTMFLTLFPRTATEDMTLEGVHIRAGQTVSVSPVAANRDERRFEHPADFDLSRDAFGHLGFGHGRHGCVGQQLARVEITEAITQLLAALPELRLVHAEQLEPMPFAHDVGTYEAGSVIVAWE